MNKTSQKKDRVDESIAVFGAGILLKHVEALSQETAGVHAGEEDIEFIHRARVASRRLRAAIPLFQECLPAKKSPVWQKNIRNVTRALGEARDTDVQIERVEKVLSKVTDEACRPGIRRLVLRLGQKRSRLQPAVVSAMDSLIKAGVIEQMHDHFASQAARAESVYVFTAALYNHSYQSITTRLDDLLSYDAIVSQPEKITELHEMRIRAKWLRYTMENFSSLYASELKDHLQVIRKVQEMLGDIHDCDVWTELLPLFLEEERQRSQEYYGHTRFFKRLIPGIEYFQTDRRQARTELYQEFAAAWENWRTEETWNSLRNAIQVPFPKPASIFPPLPPTQ
ncbi:MAG: CHAD domain-containing protein [Anaerolineaceae bacterium]|nr:CHAD domain-containing protein [Anaerolineaceae bacterium]